MPTDPNQDGRAYGRARPSHNPTLTEVGPATPMGELLRRYWHPVGLSSHATATPRAVRVLGEDLVLFRDGAGRAGLLHSHCAHRGTTLYYGKVEERGIRCCYHGWLFDVSGHCLEQPCEPDAGARFRDRVRQPWYPVEERYGLVFAYMGPADRQPVLPRWELLETLEEGEFVEADDNSVGSGGPVIVPCNWLQHFENVGDPFHVPILHGSFSGVQFVELMGKMPEVRFDETPLGVKITSIRRTDEGRVFQRVTEAVLPTVRAVPNPRVEGYARCESLGWILPIDDTHFRIYTAGRVRKSGAIFAMRSRVNGKLWHELSEEEHQRFPGDYEAQVGQGAIAVHASEHLATSDRGVVMIRRMLQRQLATLESGGNPVGVAFDADAAPLRLEAGNFLGEAESGRAA